MKNYKLTLCYDGSRYSGWQKQGNTAQTVQGKLETLLSRALEQPVEIAGSGRTDAGVHAYGQVVNFFTDGRIPTDRIVRAVNSLLPPDIVVRAAGEADRDFSARHSAKSKTYIYRIQRGEVPDPMTARYAWYIRRPLDVAAMREALGSILGTHDFSAFRASGGAPMSPVRTMYEAAVEEAAGNQLVCRIHGNGFLYHMVRNIIGTVANVGLGIITPQRFQEILDGCDRTKAAATAPACGLFLEEVDYGERFHF